MSSKQYKNVSEYLDAVSQTDSEFSETVKKQIASRQIVKALVHLRVSHDCSQTELAQKLDCSQSRISKIENGIDSNLKLKDLADYGRVFGKDITFLLSNRESKLADQVKFHAFEIRTALMKLVNLAKNDSEMVKGVANFQVEAIANILTLIKQTVEELPAPESEDQDEIIRIFGQHDSTQIDPEVSDQNDQVSLNT